MLKKEMAEVIKATKARLCILEDQSRADATELKRLVNLSNQKEFEYRRFEQASNKTVQDLFQEKEKAKADLKERQNKAYEDKAHECFNLQMEITRLNTMIASDAAKIAKLEADINRLEHSEDCLEDRNKDYYQQIGNLEDQVKQLAKVIALLSGMHL